MAFKRILIAIDDSPYSLQAVEEGCNIAFELQAKVAFLHVVDSLDTIGQLGSGVLPQEQEIAEIKKSEKLLQELKQKYITNLSIEIMIQEGNPAEVIVRKAKEWKTDLIVIGRHGIGSFKHLFLGGVVDEVVKNTPCPVMLVPYHKE